MPRVTVITPVFNGERYISETIESVSRSFFQDYEHIIVDDGSWDGTVAEISRTLDGLPEKLSNKVQIHNQANSGEATATNKGFALATGDFVIVLNADDTIEPDLLGSSVAVLDGNPKVVVTYPDWMIIDENGQVIQVVQTKEFSTERLIGNFECLPGVGSMIRRGAVNGLEPRDATYKYVSDFVFWLKICKEGPFQRIPLVLASWRDNTEGQTNQSKGLPWALEAIRAARTEFLRSKFSVESGHLAVRGLVVALIKSAHQWTWDERVPWATYLFEAFRRGIFRFPIFTISNCVYVALIVGAKSAARWLSGLLPKAK
jgi:hypothetical protein